MFHFVRPPRSFRMPPRAARSLAPMLLLAAAPVLAQPLATPLAVRPAAHSAQSSGLIAEGVIEATRQATVAARVAGKVVALRVDAGQRVQRGEVLLRLDARESAEAVVAARAALLNARAAFARTQQLVQQKFVSQSALDRARADLDAAQAQYEASQAAQSHAVVVAPMSGVVARRHIELGEMAVPGRPLVTVYAPGALRAVGSVPQSRLAGVRQAGSAVIEFPESGRRLVSRDITILPMADSATHVLTVRVALPDGDAADGVAPGLAARIHFQGEAAPRMTVPERAVVRRGAVTGVYVQAVDGRLSLRQVRLGERQANGEQEVLAGLVDGEMLVLDAVRAAIVLKQTSVGR